MDSADWDSRYAAAELLWSAGPNRFLVGELEGLHQAHAANVSDAGVFFLQFEQFVMKVIADDTGVCAEVVFFDHVDYRKDDC